MKKLEETLELAPIEIKQEEVKEIVANIEKEEEKVEEAIVESKKIMDSLKVLKSLEGFEQHDKEMDEIAEDADKAFKDLMNLGMETDIRFSSPLFAAAQGMLETKKTAKDLKIQKKLRMAQLLLQQIREERENERLKLQKDQYYGKNDNSPDAAGHFLSGNTSEILEELKNISKKNQ